MVIVGCTGNLCLIYTKIYSLLKPLNLLELTLIFSEFLLSIYFLTLIIMDWKFDKNYMKYDYDWRNSILCKILEICASSSCLLSNFSLLLITWERYTGIKKLIKINYTNFTHVVLSIIFSVIISISLSIIPVVFIKVINFIQ